MSNSFQTEYDMPEIGSVANLAEHIVYRVPGCADIMIRKALQTIYADFCRLSCVFTMTQYIKMKEEVFRYHVSPTIPHMMIDTISSVMIDNRRLERFQYAIQGNTIVLNPKLHFDDTSVLTVVAVEVPPFGSEEAPQWFLDKYGQAIVAGALVKLFAMTDKTWTDATQAQNELLTYENFLTTVRVNNASDGLQNGPGDVIDTSTLL